MSLRAWNSSKNTSPVFQLSRDFSTLSHPLAIQWRSLLRHSTLRKNGKNATYNFDAQHISPGMIVWKGFWGRSDWFISKLLITLCEVAETQMAVIPFGHTKPSHDLEETTSISDETVKHIKNIWIDIAVSCGPKKAPWVTLRFPAVSNPCRLSRTELDLEDGTNTISEQR